MHGKQQTEGIFIITDITFSLHNSIQTKIGVMLIVITTFILCSFGIYQYRTIKVQKIAELQEMADQIITRLAENVSKPMWEYDHNQVIKVVIAEMMEKNVLAVDD